MAVDDNKKRKVNTGGVATNTHMHSSSQQVLEHLSCLPVSILSRTTHTNEHTWSTPWMVVTAKHCATSPETHVPFYYAFHTNTKRVTTGSVPFHFTSLASLSLTLHPSSVSFFSSSPFLLCSIFFFIILFFLFSFFNSHPLFSSFSTFSSFCCPPLLCWFATVSLQLFLFHTQHFST